MTTFALPCGLLSRRTGDGAWATRAFPIVATVCAGWAVYANVWRFRFPAVAADEPTYSVAAWRYIHGDNAVPPAGGATNAHNFEHPPLAKFLFGLAELPAGHPSIPADRLVAAACTLATALIVGLWLGRLVGRWSGLLTAMFVAVLPMRVSGMDFRFSRYGMLDPVAEMFMAASIVCAWLWFQRHSKAAWVWAAVTGATVGLATAAKENGFLAAIGVVTFGVLLTLRRPRELIARLAQAATGAAVAALVFGLCYLPLGHPAAALRFMLAFQWRHSHAGHLTDVAGSLTTHPPWWSFLWFATQGFGWPVTVASVVCVAAALVIRHDRLVGWCVAALAGPLVFHMAIAGVVLPYYWVMWAPAWLALTAIGVHDLARAAIRRLPHSPRTRLRAAPAVGLFATGAAVVAVVFGCPAIVDSVRLATQTLTGAQRLPAVLAATHLRGGVIVGGTPAWQLWDAKLPGPVSYTVPTDLYDYDAVEVGASCGHPVPADIRALLDVNTPSGTLHLLYRDSKIAVYGGRQPLQPPTQAEIAAEPPVSASAGC